MKTIQLLPLRWAKTTTLYVMLICLGYVQSYWREPKNNYHHFSTIYHNYQQSEIVLLDELEERENTFRVTAEVVRLYNQHSSIRVQGKALLYILKTKNKPDIHAGQHVLIPIKWQLIPASTNPGSFNYQQYCASNGIYLSAFVPNESIHVLNRSSFSVFRSWSLCIRNKLITYLPDSSTWAIAQALLLGYRKGIDPELYQAYANTGVMHLIAISGMHIGLLYMAFSFLLSAIPFLTERKKTTTLITILSLWLFAFLSGLQPSILRSVIMFSMIGIGHVIERKTLLINNLACSAFLLLCFFPNWLFDAGFQLSYLAVLSLYFFYTPIYNLLYFKRKVPDYVWKLICATLAAQCLTFPISIYYFHQFPLSFLLTNIVGIITTTLIIYLEVVLLLFSWIRPLAFLLGRIISTLIHFTNDAVMWFSHFKWNTLNGLYLYPYQVFLIYALILCLSMYIFFRVKIILPVALTSLFFLLGSTVYTRWEALHQHKLIWFDIKGEEALAFIQGQKMELYHDNLSTSSKNNRYVFQPARTIFHINTDHGKFVLTHSVPAFDLYLCRNMSVMRLKNWNFHSSTKLYVDLLILPEQFSAANLQWITKHFTRKTRMIRSSIRRSIQADYICDTLGKMGFSVHNTRLKGAYVCEIR